MHITSEALPGILEVHSQPGYGTKSKQGTLAPLLQCISSAIVLEDLVMGECAIWLNEHPQPGGALLKVDPETMLDTPLPFVHHLTDLPPATPVELIISSQFGWQQMPEMWIMGLANITYRVKGTARIFKTVWHGGQRPRAGACLVSPDHHANG